MKLKSYILSTVALLPAFASAQSAVDALTLSTTDIRGTARYMSMGGAFGALGGDLTTLSQNPAGIGVYRSNEIGVTMDLNSIGAKSVSQGGTATANRTPFELNNIGGVITLKLNSSVVPNLNFGFTYNRRASFNRSYKGQFGSLNTSMTNWMAGISNSQGVTVGDVTPDNGYNPYNPADMAFRAPWISILGYQSYFINPFQNGDYTDWYGQWWDPLHDSDGNEIERGTSGTGEFAVTESGGIDSFNIALGGNFGNILFWGMDFDITNLNYTRNTYYGENLQNAYVMGDNGIEPVSSQWNLNNYYHVSGQGFAYKLGLIFKPIQEFRVGFSFSTPTYYSLNQEYLANAAYSYNGEAVQNQYTNSNLITNGGIPGLNYFRFRSPWKIDVSAAGVIGTKFIVSAEYEWTQYSKMKFNDPTSYYEWYTPTNLNTYDQNGTNGNIADYYRNTNTFKIGAEYRVTPQFSIRAGYANVSSPVKEKLTSGDVLVSTQDLFPGYLLDESTNYITAGLGYRVKGFYADLAYVYKTQKATYHGFTDDPASLIRGPQADMTFNSNQVVLSLGYKF